ncbi:MAG TPA: hypothetical protein EYN79_10280 [Planctomycetes bacterium]|nr:hypothetical protein [Planctomycetota bacterium]
MLCEICGHNEARVHLTDIVNNTKKEFQLCRECAQEKGVSIQFHLKEHKQMSLPEFFGAAKAMGATQSETTEENECPRCSISYDQFRASGKFGCSHDYEVFRDRVEYLIEKIHGDDQHRGRAPVQRQQEQSFEDDIVLLRKKLRSAIDQEQYEKAANIRDRISMLEKEL